MSLPSEGGIREFVVKGAIGLGLTLVGSGVVGVVSKTISNQVELAGIQRSLIAIDSRLAGIESLLTQSKNGRR
jgi:hypothetical protein